MKLKTHSIDKQPNNRLRVLARWTDEMRRPADVKMVVKRNLPDLDGDNTLVEADERDVRDAVFGIADIAWEMGWRPAGLPGTVANLIQTYKLPPKE